MNPQLVVWATFRPSKEHPGVHVVPLLSGGPMRVDHCIYCREGVCQKTVERRPDRADVVIHGPPGAAS